MNKKDLIDAITKKMPYKKVLRKRRKSTGSQTDDVEEEIKRATFGSYDFNQDPPIQDY